MTVRTPVEVAVCGSIAACGSAQKWYAVAYSSVLTCRRRVVDDGCEESITQQSSLPN